MTNKETKQQNIKANAAAAAGTGTGARYAKTRGQYQATFPFTIRLSVALPTHLEVRGQDDVGVVEVTLHKTKRAEKQGGRMINQRGKSETMRRAPRAPASWSGSGGSA